jgi:hypothetical protein
MKKKRPRTPTLLTQEAAARDKQTPDSLYHLAKKTDNWVGYVGAPNLMVNKEIEI